MVRDIDTHMPFQYLWVLGGSSIPQIKHKVTIEPVNGHRDVQYIRENARKSFLIRPNDDYLPPDVISVAPSSALVEYFEYAGAFVLADVTTDVTVTGTCRRIPHTYAEMASYTHEDLNGFKLTHEQLGRVI